MTASIAAGVRRGLAGRALALFAAMSGNAVATAAPDVEQLAADPHRNALGFFDVHLCNWPERPQFLKLLFSTTQFDRIRGMQVFDPSGRAITRLDPSRYLRLQRKGRAEKRVFLLDVDLPSEAVGGWYRIEVTDVDGEVHAARDLVPLTRIGRVAGMRPDESQGPARLPVTLRWEPVPGAKYYQVYVRDAWDQRLVFSSRLLSETRIAVPPGRLAVGGDYVWVVHARDLNGHVLLGDFHNGSMSPQVHFSVAEN